MLLEELAADADVVASAAAEDDDAVAAVATDVETADSVRRELDYVDDDDDVCYFFAWCTRVAS